MKLRLAIALALTWLTLAAAAQAHQDVDAARRLYENADFHGALGRLENAVASDGLDRAELLVVYELRALIHYALDEQAALDEALLALAALDPDHTFAEEAPPGLAEQLSSIPVEPLALRIRKRARGGSAEFRAETTGGGQKLVRSVTIAGRTSSGRWSTATDDVLSLEIEAGETVEFFVEVTGPGGATILRLGDLENPEIFVGPEAAEQDPQRRRRRRRALVGGIAGGVAAAVLITVLAVVLTAPEDDTLVTGPILQ